MSINRKVSTANNSIENSPKVSSHLSIRQSLRHSLNYSKKSSAINRSFNNSQNTDRSQQSPRGLNSQRQRHQHNNSHVVKSDVRRSMNETQSFLDSSYLSAFGSTSNNKKSDKIQERRLSMAKPSFGFNFYRMPKV